MLTFNRFVTQTFCGELPDSVGILNVEMIEHQCNMQQVHWVVERCGTLESELSAAKILHAAAYRPGWWHGDPEYQYDEWCSALRIAARMLRAGVIASLTGDDRVEFDALR